ncbi:ABC transporter ATP-binding protein [Paralcaligenes ureilyticus]|nr:ABC transporter ATP-binding protein [Paralcaligenes ureilyticus]
MDPTRIVDVSGLRVVAHGETGETIAIVRDISFSIDRGEVLALIGESGSGKTTIALSLMGYARSGCRIVGGRIRIGKHDVLSLDAGQLAGIRGHTVSYIAQSAAAAFNPAKTLMNQVIESALIHKTIPREAAQKKAVELFRALALPDPEHIGQRYPHQVSGGQLQRVMAAMALITDPDLVIMDEPTTALDVTTQIEVLRAFKRVVKELGTTAVYVSHDLAVVAQMADRIVVLKDGQMREAGTTERILAAPENAYTQSLLAAAAPEPRMLPPLPEERVQGVPLLQITGLLAGYGKPDSKGIPSICVLDDINLSIRRGTTVGIIGESGSGKTTLARVVAGMIAPFGGNIALDGVSLSPALSGRTREQFRRIQIVFQNADTALNPSHSIGRILARPLAFYHDMSGKAQRRRILELLDLVQLPASVFDRLPGELSGGQKQRANLARALAAKPDLILCDEVTSALDTVVGAAILDLLADLRRELNVSYMFISHDISTVRAICDEIIVLYAGRMVAVRPREALAEPPYHPYSHLLMSSVPELRTGWLDRVCSRPVEQLPVLQASAAFPGVCPFLGRCALRVDGVCNKTPPPTRELSNSSRILCHRTEAELKSLQAPLTLLEGVAA